MKKTIPEVLAPYNTEALPDEQSPSSHGEAPAAARVAPVSGFGRKGPQAQHHAIMQSHREAPKPPATLAQPVIDYVEEKPTKK